MTHVRGHIVDGMDWWQGVMDWWDQDNVGGALWGLAVAFGVPFLGGAVGSGWIWKHFDRRRADKDLTMRTEVETTKVFLTVSSRAQGMVEGNPDARISHPERLAALRLLGWLISNREWLREPGLEQLRDMAERAVDELNSADWEVERVRIRRYWAIRNDELTDERRGELEDWELVAEPALAEASQVANAISLLLKEVDPEWHQQWMKEFRDVGGSPEYGDLIVSNHTKVDDRGRVVLIPRPADSDVEPRTAKARAGEKRKMWPRRRSSSPRNVK